jgi:enoyl-CoA hydratase/carnithine racemase
MDSASLPPNDQVENASELVVDVLAPGVRQIRLNRPSRLNALGFDMVVALKSMVAAQVTEGARVLLIRGTGRGFCVGADLKERSSMDEAARLAHNRAINDAFDAIAAIPIPTIAVINGLALGGGCELAVACDLRFAADDATIGLTEARIGVIPGAGGTQRLPRLIGVARALDLMLTGEPIDAARAEAIGLVQKAVPAEELDEYVLRYATLLASRSLRTASILKRVVYQGNERPLAEALGLERAALRDIFGSADYAEGLAAFAERRPPKFSG